jgi:hypothetical protein
MVDFITWYRSSLERKDIRRKALRLSALRDLCDPQTRHTRRMTFRSSALLPPYARCQAARGEHSVALCDALIVMGDWRAARATSN